MNINVKAKELGHEERDNEQSKAGGPGSAQPKAQENEHADPWQSGGLPLLNIAATCTSTRSLGPGLRAAIWVQGCPLNCLGCIAPDWIPRQLARLASPQEIVEELLSHPEVTGLTFSGGEPMLQAAGLAAVARLARAERPLSVICFTGFLWERLKEHPPGPGVIDLLSEIDLLIDGPYIAAQNSNEGLRGSHNQRIHYLTDRLTPLTYDFEHRQRQAEIHIENGAALLVGVPPHGLAKAFHTAIEQANLRFGKAGPRMPLVTGIMEDTRQAEAPLPSSQEIVDLSNNDN